LNTPISEDAMVGAAIGSAMQGMRPIVEMQFADFSSTALNQILNNAGTHYWRTNVPVPITVRLPSGGTKGSGPFHSQSMESIYAHYPGLIVMTPATVEDAYSMLLEAVAIGGSSSFTGVSLGALVAWIHSTKGISMKSHAMTAIPGTTDVVYPQLSWAVTLQPGMLMPLMIVLVSLYPAWRASRLDPVQALKSV